MFTHIIVENIALSALLRACPGSAPSELRALLPTHSRRRLLLLFASQGIVQRVAADVRRVHAAVGAGGGVLLTPSCCPSTRCAPLLVSCLPGSPQQCSSRHSPGGVAPGLQRHPGRRRGKRLRGSRGGAAEKAAPAPTLSRAHAAALLALRARIFQGSKKERCEKKTKHWLV